MLFCTLRLFGQPCKSQRNTFLGLLHGCPKNKNRRLLSILRENEKIAKKKIGSRRVHRRESIKSANLQERNPWGPKIKLEERTQDESLKQERCAETLVNLQRMFTNSRFHSLAEAWVMRAHSSTNPEERFLWSIVKLQCICHVWRTSAQERRNSQEFQIRHHSGDIH